MAGIRIQAVGAHVLKHEQIWLAIDQLAVRHGMSSSGLARRAGLDPTTFNKSKRLTTDNRQRWPSTESIAKILVATGESLDSFVSLVTASASASVRTLPLISASEAAKARLFDEKGTPTGDNWDEIALSAMFEPGAFAYEIDTTDLMPLYCEGNVLIAVPSSPVRRGDRVIVQLKSGIIIVGEVRRMTGGNTELAINDEIRTISQGEIAWTARIHWVSQ